jgi:two-component system, chemotaxis family, protein-glutamate methylesterase/glutaminase
VIKVLIVEDSAVVRDLLLHVLSSDPEIHVVGAVSSGEEALETAGRTQPNVITMDIHLPKMDGFDTTRRIMETQPTPIVIVSSRPNLKEATITFKAMEAGALAVVETPPGVGNSEHQAAVAELLRTVKLMSEVKVVRRWVQPPQRTGVRTYPTSKQPELKRPADDIKIVAIGASTGGPIALQTILSNLPGDFPVSLLVVQHMTRGFTSGFVEWLNRSCVLPVRVARDGERICSGQVYVAPDDAHMKVGHRETILLTKDEPENGLRPSVSQLFRSIATVYGRNAVGVLLTGMGKDGSQELKLLKEKGAITIAQDRESSVVYGMPGEAIKLEAATYVLSPDKIAAALTSLVNTGTRISQ